MNRRTLILGLSAIAGAIAAKLGFSKIEHGRTANVIHSRIVSGGENLRLWVEPEGWRPITSSPRDGTAVEIWMATRGGGIGIYHFDGEHWMEVGAPGRGIMAEHEIASNGMPISDQLRWRPLSADRLRYEITAHETALTELRQISPAEQSTSA